MKFPALIIFLLCTLSLFSETKGKKLLCFFHQASQKEIEQWCENLDPELLSEIEIIAYVFPGGTFFLLPEKVAISKARKQIQKNFDEALSQLDEDTQKKWKNISIQWIVDLKKENFHKYQINAGKTTLILLEKEQEIGRYEDYSNIRKIHLQWQLKKK